MTLSRSQFAAVSSAFILASALICTVDAQSPAPGASPGVAKSTANRITAATNITLRATPALDAAAVAQLPLGTEVTDSGPAGLDKKWVRVRLADGREGWLQSSLTRTLDPIWRWPTFDRIIAERLGRKGDGFPALSELTSFIERVAPEYTDPDGRGRIELARLRALSATLSTIPMTGGRREPYATWLNARKAEVVYDEPGGHWMLASGPLWDLHARQSKTTSADEIAWMAVTNGMPGECEGQVSCYITVRNLLHGEYLRRHPSGPHAAESVALLKQTADLLSVPPKAGVAYRFDRKQDCRDLSSGTDALIAAVQGTRVEGKDAALVSLNSLKKICMQGGS
ncbi:MAG TPA: SH3 domain-containing protein [Vicinamibacterales bacterium]|nr:SH3 domain-containing protein [Vicinamibacterales bacterium]